MEDDIYSCAVSPDQGLALKLTLKFYVNPKTLTENSKKFIFIIFTNSKVIMINLLS